MLTENSPKIKFTQKLPHPLKDHQLALIHQTMEFEKEIQQDENPKKNRCIILGDLPGAGKTNVVLGHLWKIKELLLKENPYLDEDEEERDPTFLVVPQNIITQWIQSIQKFFPKKLKYKKMVSYEDMMSLHKNTRKLLQYDIILTTPLQYHMIITTLKDQFIKMKRVIFDEIDTISSMIQTKIDSDFIWFVSASFKKDRIGSYYQEIQENELDRRTLLCDESFIRRSFPLEVPIMHKYVSVNKYVDETLCDLVSPTELKGMNALDYTKIKNEYFKKIPIHDDGATELCIEENRNELDFRKIRMEDMKKEYERYIEEIQQDGIDEDDSEYQDDTRVQMIKEYRKRIETETKEMNDLEKRKVALRDRVCKNRICMICYQDIETKKVKVKKEDSEEEEERLMKEIFRSKCCKTDFCIDCLHYLFEVEKRRLDMKKKEEELKRRREERQNGIREEEIKIEIEEQKEEEDEKKEVTREEEYREVEIECKRCEMKCKYDGFQKTRLVRRYSKEEKMKDRTSKIDRFEQILQKNREVKKKYIVFSDYYNTFRYVKDSLDKLQIKYIELDGGNIESIDKAIQEYREGESQVMLSNSTFFGCGMNMEFTTDIIFMHKMEEGIERQVIGRAQRPGRTSTLEIHYIFYYNEEYGKEIKHEGHTQFYIEPVHDYLKIENIEEVEYELEESS